MRWLGVGLFTALAMTVCGAALAASYVEEPRITAQGFSIDTPLRAEAGRFSSVRVRIEAPSRIAKLLLSEGDVETDLANTPDRTLFALFGLDKRPMNAFDITLEFAPYMNTRLTAAATYRIGITVVDRAGNVAQGALTVTVIGDDAAPLEDRKVVPQSQRLQESLLTLKRQGAGPVEPAGASPLTWVTREAVNVTLRLRAGDAREELRQLDTSSWETLFTREGLAKRLSGTPPVPYVDVPAARNGAAGTVIALSDGDGDTLIHIRSSSTSVSAPGTTVTLTASVRN